jgi:EAL domain-containing protein (putative c-di-GMP-specific phosphodiesterase class I)/CheY-like chemotaxis protein
MHALMVPDGSAGTIRVLIADDEIAVREVLATLIATDSGLDVVGTAGDAESAIELAARERPDVALLDVRMPGGGGARAAREIVRRSPDTRVVALSAFEDADSVLKMIRAGASGYIAKSESTHDILDAVRRHASAEPIPPAEATLDMARVIAEEIRERARWAEERRERLERIRAVVSGAGLSIAYQPIFDLRDDHVVGVEALARFSAEPTRGPDAWFAEAEAVGRGEELELAAIRRALDGFARVESGAFLSLNVSPGTCLSPRLPALISEIPGHRLCLEITEHAAVGDYGALEAALSPLRARGVRVAIDDACAGPSSLRHVIALQPDLIKLDVALTRDVDSDENRSDLVTALVGFASRVDADVVAEGIETAPQLRTLGDLGVRCGQGFYLGRPGAVPPSGTWEPSRRTTAADDPGDHELPGGPASHSEESGDIDVG